MTTYTAYFRTDANYAEHDFEAETPDQALAAARTFYAEQEDELWFESYDSGQPVNEIAVHDEHGDELAVWLDEDMRLRLAAQDLLDAAELGLRELRQFYSDGESEALQVLTAAIAKAKGSQSRQPRASSRSAAGKTLPLDA